MHCHRLRSIGYIRCKPSKKITSDANTPELFQQYGVTNFVERLGKVTIKDVNLASILHGFSDTLGELQKI
jgi:hypothetical protein